MLWPSGSAERVHHMVNQIAKVHITIFVNWMPLWDESFNAADATTADAEDDATGFEEKVDFKSRPSPAQLTSRYENLFQNTSARPTAQ
jgi:hypothetical protein